MRDRGKRESYNVPDGSDERIPEKEDGMRYEAAIEQADGTTRFVEIEGTGFRSATNRAERLLGPGEFIRGISQIEEDEDAGKATT